MNTRALKPVKRRMNVTKRNLFWDIGIAAGFLVVFSQEITGDTLHEWLGMALFVGLLAHVLFHGQWVVTITRRFFTAKLPMKMRFNYLVNAGLAGAFVLMAVSGLMISESVMPLLGLGHGDGLWERVHEVASHLTLAAVGLHVLLHWKWLWLNGQKYVLKGM